MKIPIAVIRGAIAIKADKHRFMPFPHISTVHRMSMVAAVLNLPNDHHFCRRWYECSAPQCRIVRFTNHSFHTRDKLRPISQPISRRHSSNSTVPTAISNEERPMTVRERVFTFPGSVLLLWKDWLLYRNIRDAAATKRNAWTKQDLVIQGPKEGQTTTGTTVLVCESSSVVPWRQREQQRRFMDSLRTVLPTVVAWLLPIIGYIPMFLAIAAPRQLLSRHFFNQYEIIQFNRMAYYQRYVHFESVRNLARSGHRKQSTDTTLRDENQTPRSTDFAMGHRSVEMQTVYERFEHIQGNITTTHNGFAFDTAPILSVTQMSRPYLVEFALAIGIFQTIPAPWNARLAHWSPSWWLQRQVRHLSQTITEDDRSLLTVLKEEGMAGIAVALRDLSDIEVMDACLLRGVPVCNVTFVEMRVRLVKHLLAIESLFQNTGTRHSRNPQQYTHWNDEAIGLFSQHLAIIDDSGVQQGLDSGAKL